MTVPPQMEPLACSLDKAINPYNRASTVRMLAAAGASGLPIPTLATKGFTALHWSIFRHQHPAVVAAVCSVFPHHGLAATTGPVIIAGAKKSVHTGSLPAHLAASSGRYVSSEPVPLPAVARHVHSSMRLRLCSVPAP